MKTKPDLTPLHILQTLTAIRGVRRTQAAFLASLLTLWLAIPGRLNFANLARYGQLTERSYRSWFDKPLDWQGLNTALVLQMQHQQQVGTVGILCVDASFVSKSGQMTPGLAKFWNGCQGRPEQGLELSACTWVDLETRQPFVLNVRQTASMLPPETTRVQAYAEHVCAVFSQLPLELRLNLKMVVGDAYYAKKSFIDRVLRESEMPPIVSKLRKDADLRYLYAGPRSGKAGRPQKYDGKVDLTDLSRWEVIPWADSCTVHSQRLYHAGQKRCIRVVAMTWPPSNNRKSYTALLFSTDPDMAVSDIIQGYAARFEMEFPFRDAKQHAGLTHCQSRQATGLDFHWNMALLTTNLARASQLLERPDPSVPLVFSMENLKRLAYNELFAERIIAMLPLAGTWEKCREQLRTLLNLGVKAA